MKIGELFIALGFDVDEAKLNGFSDKINGLQKDMLILSGTAAATLYGFDKFIRGSIDSATALENLKDITGENTEALEKWESAGHLANIAMSYEAVGESIASVSKALSATAMGGDTGAFSMLGVKWYDQFGQTRKALDLMNEIRDRMPEIQKRFEMFGDTGGKHAKLLETLSAIGITQGMWQALTESQEKFNKDAGDYKVVDSTLEKTKILGQEIDRIERKLENIKDEFVGDLAPGIERALDQVLPHVTRIIDGFNAIPSWLKDSAAIIAGSLAIMFSPLFAAGVAATAVLELLNKIGEIKQAGGIDAYANKDNDLHQSQMQQLADYWNGKSHRDLMDIVLHPSDGRDQIQSSLRGTQNQQSTINQNNTINVHSNGDPKDTANATVDVLQKQMNNALGELNNGAHQ